MEGVGGIGEILGSESGNDVVEMEHVFPPKRTSSDGQWGSNPYRRWLVHPWTPVRALLLLSE